MSEQIQDVQFAEGDDRQTLMRKLRILQDEVIRLAREVSQIKVIEGVVDFGQLDTQTGAATPAAAAGFIRATINGVSVRVAYYP